MDDTPRRGLAVPTFEEPSGGVRDRNGTTFDATFDGDGGDAPTPPRRAASDDDEPIEGRYLSADEIFAIDDSEQREVWVPEWKTNIILVSLTGAERDKYMASIQYVDKRGRQLVDQMNSNAKLLSMCAVRPDGMPLFTRHQVQLLQRKNSGVIARLARICSDMNGFNLDAEEEKERRQGLD